MKPDIKPRGEHYFGEAPHSIPIVMPDRNEKPVTLLVGPHGEPILIKIPRFIGFRPERAK